MFSKLYIHVFLILFLVTVKGNGSVSRNNNPLEKRAASYDESVSRAAHLVSDDTYLRQTLSNILVPRVVGTENHTAVFNYIANELRKLDWYVDIDGFNDRTPFGTKTFRNIIATPNIQASRYLDIACHFDSKRYNDIVFYGATDSAVPCAMMLHLARSLDTYLKKHRNDDLALRLIFFDGEEAFLSWNEGDSLYGSRHLAKKWGATPDGKGASMLHKIDLLVLLDLLGAPNPKFYSFFPHTMEQYKMVLNAQSRLSTSGLLQPNTRYFYKKSTNNYIEDDHIPFLKRGVPILHIIPVPFPRVWHTEDDDYNAIDFPTVNNLMKILTVFVVDYLGLKLK